MIGNYSIKGILTANIAMIPFVANASEWAEGKGQQPNVVFILIDDMGWRDLGCFGSDFYETPNIDKMAENGIRFTSAYAACHVSSPSRACILTGMYPARTGITDWLPGRGNRHFQKLATPKVVQGLPRQTETIAETLRDNGYHTAIIGKWHLGEDGSVPQEHGFDMHIPNGYLKGWPNTYYAPFKMNGYNGKEGDYLTDKMTDEAVRYIKDNKDNPFFLLLSHFAVHDPIQGRADLVKKYTEKLKRIPKNELAAYVLEGNPDDPDLPADEELEKLIKDPVYSAHRILPRNLVKIKQIQDNVHFAAMVESVDESVGRISATLDSLGLADNTILIFYSDNGGMSAANYGNYRREIANDRQDAAYSTSVLPLRGGKGWMYEGGLRVPLIVKWPGKIQRGVVSDYPVTGSDFYKTIVSMTGSNAPEGAGIDGIDISPAMRGEDMANRDIFWHFPHNSNHGMLSPSGGIRSGDYKLIQYFENGTVQLFNIKEDISERNDISVGNEEIVDSLRVKLESWRKDVGAKMPTPNITYDPVFARQMYIKVKPPMVSPYGAGADPGYNIDYNLAVLMKSRSFELVQRYEQTYQIDFLDKARKVFSKEIDRYGSMLMLSDRNEEKSMRDLFEIGISAIYLYQTTGDERYHKTYSDIRRIEEQNLDVIRESDILSLYWNQMSAEMFSMDGDGHFIMDILPISKSASRKSKSVYDSFMAGYRIGFMNNSLLIVPWGSFTFNTGAKYGDGSISVSSTADGISVHLDRYQQIDSRKRYPFEILVKDKSAVKSVTLNGKDIDWKSNDRGFIEIIAPWNQGDNLRVNYR